MRPSPHPARSHLTAERAQSAKKTKSEIQCVLEMCNVSWGGKGVGHFITFCQVFIVNICTTKPHIEIVYIYTGWFSKKHIKFHQDVIVGS